MTGWYAVRTKPHQEEVAEATLRSLGIESLCPRLKQDKIVRRRAVTVTGPLFPGYLFARLDPTMQFRAVHYARGVRGVVTFGTSPASIEEEIIEGIRNRLQDGVVCLPRHEYRPGDPVTIQAGPLRGLETVFERELSDRQRVVLLLNTLAYQAHVVVPLEQVAG